MHCALCALFGEKRETSLTFFFHCNENSLCGSLESETVLVESLQLMYDLDCCMGWIVLIAYPASARWWMFLDLLWYFKIILYNKLFCCPVRIMWFKWYRINVKLTKFELNQYQINYITSSGLVKRPVYPRLVHVGFPFY